MSSKSLQILRCLRMGLQEGSCEEPWELCLPLDHAGIAGLWEISKPRKGERARTPLLREHGGLRGILDPGMCLQALEKGVSA